MLSNQASVASLQPGSPHLVHGRYNYFDNIISEIGESTIVHIGSKVAWAADTPISKQTRTKGDGTEEPNGQDVLSSEHTQRTAIRPMH